MNNKKSTVRVKNTFSKLHLANLKPYQTLEIFLSADLFPDPKVNVYGSSYIYEISSCEVEGGVFYTFEINPRILNWSEYSSVYLGEIWITSEGKISRVFPILDCTNSSKKGIVTSINPDSFDARINLDNILEVIVFNPEFHWNDVWEWEWLSGSNHKLNCIKSSVVYAHINNSLHTSNPNALYATKVRRIDVSDSFRQTVYRQHHYWFKLDKDVAKHLSDQKKIEQLGVLRFCGYENSAKQKENVKVIRQLNLYCNLYKKQSRRDWGDLTEEVTDDKITQQSKYTTVVKEKKSNFDYRAYDKAYSEAFGFPSTANQSKRHYQNTSNVSSYGVIRNDPKEYTLKAVELKPVESIGLADDCTLVCAAPPATVGCDKEKIVYYNNLRENIMPYGII